MNTPTLLATLLAAAALLTTGCKSPAPIDELTTTCTDPRPQVCTFQYNPVCALEPGTAKNNWQWKTHGNGCSACSQPAVLGYKQGECGEEKSRVQ